MFTALFCSLYRDRHVEQSINIFTVKMWTIHLSVDTAGILQM